MPNCLKCEINLPIYHKTPDGKLHNLCKRKYCLSCSPFGLKNRRKLHNPGALQLGEEISTCQECGNSFVYNRKAGNRTTKCASCYRRGSRIKIKEKAVEYKGGSCVKCGYNKSLRALVFHHRDPHEKNFGIGGNRCRAWKKIQIELDKCDLLCSNCHDEKHDKMDEDRRYKNRLKNIVM